MIIDFRNRLSTIIYILSHWKFYRKRTSFSFMRIYGNLTFMDFNNFLHIRQSKTLPFYIVDISSFLSEEFFKNFGFINSIHSHSFVGNFDDVEIGFIPCTDFYFWRFRRIFVRIIKKINQLILDVKFINQEIIFCRVEICD